MSDTTGDLGRRLGLLVVTDAELAGERGVLSVVRAALDAGASAVQLRAKDAPSRDMVALGHELRAATRGSGALLFVNDRIDVALVVEADGAHLGDDDLPLAAARRIVPEGFLLGRSVDTIREAVAAEREGADYLGAGPAYATRTKPGLPPPLGPDGIGAIALSVALPVVGIGGIGEGGAGAIVGSGAAGVAVIRAIMAADDPGSATHRLLREMEGARR
jgi:thiamine-phosphate pyrophosphorylase